MHIRYINFPNNLINAQRNNDLVIFSGAGVSMGGQANYPDFSDLANNISAGSLERESVEPIDRFLGRLEKHGVQVHHRAKELLTNPDSRPNPLHFLLLNLFDDVNSIRLVTTNFDNHFTTASKKCFGVLPEIFYAPALPLGNDFNGIVYLHGSVEKDDMQMVLTDRNFGMAYLTEGWATRFLQALFQKYTVLFVGYSHDDLVMHYLSRGLPPDPANRRFAITEKNPDFWSFLNIIPVTYLPDNNHAMLVEGIERWVNRSKMGALDHERRIKEIVSFPPPLKSDDEDYVEEALKASHTAQYFVRRAKSVDWLHWIESKKIFKPLFQTAQDTGEVAQQIAYWFADNFICEHSDEALALIQRNGQNLNPDLWLAIAQRLHVIEPLPDSSTFAKWVNVLLRSAKPEYQTSHLEYLLNKCRYPEDNATALLLFGYLTNPRFHLGPGFRISSDDAENVYYEVTISGEEFCLKEAWEKFFYPNLSDFAKYLELILTSHLQQTHFILRSIGKADYRGDITSFHRYAIELHEQDNQNPKKMDVLIDAARVVLEWILINEPGRAMSVIHAWYNSDVPILKRLAVHGIIENSNIPSDEKIEWVLQRKLLYVLDLQHEVFRLLAKSYPAASTALRLRLLENVEQGPQGIYAENRDAGSIQYDIYNMLYWLHGNSEDCTIANERLEAIQQAHPDFKPSEHPDFSHWLSIGGRKIGDKSPFTVEELLSKNPDEILEMLLTYKGNFFKGPNRSDFLSTITEAVVRSYQWSLKLAAALTERKKWDSDIWRSILLGWQKSIKTEKGIYEVLTFLGENTQLYSFSDYISDLLMHLIKEYRSEFSDTSLLLAETVAEQIWDTCVSMPTEEISKSSDWLGRAINHPGGKITQFWLYSLSKRKADSGDKWAGIPENHKRYFVKVVSGSSIYAELGRVSLSSQLHFLSALDLDWSRKNILPLLDWSDLRRSQQAWHGYLYWGHWTESLLPELLLLYEKSFAHLDNDLASVRDRFSEHIAVIAVYGLSNRLTNGWLYKFLKAVSSEDRQNWTNHIGRQLRSMNNEEAVKNLWNRWLNEYWTDRTTGVPVSLNSEEIKAMVKWSSSLGIVFDEAVEKILKMTAPSFEHTALYHEFNEKDFPSSHPISLTKLLLHLLPQTPRVPWFCNELNKIVHGLAQSNVPAQDLQKLRDELSRLGCVDIQ